MDREIAHEENEKQLLRIHRGRGEGEGITGEPSVTKGLALLHSVRFISLSRQRTQFVPFILRNSTGFPLYFSTLTSLPSKVLFNPSIMLRNTKVGVANTNGLDQPPRWVKVEPHQEVPFDFIARAKMRHKVSDLLKK